MDRVKDFARRLIRRPCLWKNCRAILDSGEKLLKHAKVVHGKEIENTLYVCRWKECQSTRGFTDSEKLVRHLQWHVNSRIYCGFKECGFQTQLPIQLAEHVTAYHGHKDRLRPYAVPVELAREEVPVLVDDTLPAYMSVPVPVSPQAILLDRHQKIGPWVLHHIFGKVFIKKGAVNAALPLRSQRLLGRQAQSVPTDDMFEPTQHRYNPQDEYEFLKKEGVTKTFASLTPLPLLINDVEMSEETELAVNNAGTSGPETTVNVGGSDMQGPARPAVDDRRDLISGSAGGVVTEPSGGMLGPVEEADEVEELL